jgi:molybdenum cofactor cytidylyltransferase
MIGNSQPVRAANKSTAALILAAGESSRMKTLKPLLPLEGQMVIEKVIGLFRMIDIKNILVVLGYAADQLIPVLDKHDVTYVINKDYQNGMFSSVRTGVEHLGGGCRSFFIMPADMPFVRVETLQKLLLAFQETGKAVCRPQYQGRRGHPPLIAATLIPAILAFKDQGGLRALFGAHEESCVDVDCGDPGILIDLDTPEDYQKYGLS